MELWQLRYFLQIAASGSLSRASSILHVAQPALSRQIKALEAELGVTLLHRTGRGVGVTAAGQALGEGAETLIRAAGDLERTMQGFRSTMAGEAVIGLPPTIGRILALPLTRHVRSRFPRVNLRVTEGFSGTMLEWLETGRIDAAVLYGEPRGPAIRAEPVVEEDLSVVAPAPAQRPCGAPIRLAELAGRPLILSTPHHALRRLVDARAAQAGVALTIGLEFDSLQATIDAVKAGMGWTILPAVTVQAEIERGELVVWPVVDPPLTRTLVVATAAQRADALTARELGRLLRDEMMALAPVAHWRVIARPSTRTTDDGM